MCHWLLASQCAPFENTGRQAASGTRDVWVAAIQHAANCQTADTSLSLLPSNKSKQDNCRHPRRFDPVRTALLCLRHPDNKLSGPPAKITKEQLVAKQTMELGRK